MSWANELYKVYELAPKFDPERPKQTMLPLSHSTANAQIEILIDENGEYLDSSEVSKEEAETIIPVTEDSGARGNGVFPMPFADKLVYIAEDYNAFANGKHADNSEYFSAYMSQLKLWYESDHSHLAVKAVYNYLIKGEIMHDLVNEGVLEVDEVSGKLSSKKRLHGNSQDDAFVRFVVDTKNGMIYPWKDKGMHDSFYKFNQQLLRDTGKCYATGEECFLTYKNPTKIRNSGDKAKLISSNDDKGFTYRGRFANNKEAFAIGYDFSQKMHIALKWLRGQQSESYDTLTLVTWNSALGHVASVTESVCDTVGDEDYSSVPEFSKLLNKNLLGGKTNIDFDSKVMIMGLDAATTGRLSIAIYTELAESQFYANLKKWHDETRWWRYDGRFNATVEDSCNLIRLANALYGTEQGGRLECDKKKTSELILRLLPCVAEGRRIPRDIVQTLVNKASSPMSYDKKYNHRTVLENACALIRKECIDYGKNVNYCKGEITMAYDPNNTDRSYLFGCLLAIADKAESDTYEKDEKRPTNARRLWSAFSARPYQTWQIIEERIEPYLEKNMGRMSWYTRHLNEIMGKLTPEAFADNSKLSPMYLIGYHHYNALLWAGKEDKNEEE